jgi:hypothetical protein
MELDGLTEQLQSFAKPWKSTLMNKFEIWIGVLQHASIEKCIEDSIADAYRFNVCG